MFESIIFVIIRITMNIQQIFEVVFKNKTWSGYELALQLQKDYHTFFHGQNVSEHLRTIKKRESDEELTERINCTNFMNESLYRYLTRNIDKLSYLNASVVISKEDSSEFKKTLSNVFDNKDLRQYIHSCLTDDMLCDANGLLVFTKDEDDLVKPSFISSSAILWKTAKRGHVKEIIVKTSEGFLYQDSEFTINFIHTDKVGSDFSKIEDEVPAIVSDSKTKTNYIVDIQKSEDFIPFVSVGYQHHKHNKLVYTSFLHSALSYFKKVTSIGSEYDITELKQAFPKVFAYETKCEGYSTKPCDSGYCATTDSDCEKCQGTGVLISKSGQDAVVIPLPDLSRGGELADLSKLYHEVSAPIATLEYQRKVIKETFEAAHQSIYGKQDESKVNKTATARLIELELTNQSLFPFAENIKRIYETSVQIISSYYNIQEQAVSFRFPQKLIELNESELIELIEVAKANELPSYIIGEYEHRLAQLIFNQNSYKSRMYDINRTLNPFPDKSVTELVVLLDNNAISHDDFILAVNFDKILNEVSEEYLQNNVTIHSKTMKEIKSDLNKALEAYKKTLQQKPVLDLGA